ncbi:MAG: ABC transporter substrate-binding protein [Deltaproteobacteria bacterium]|nr:ABC transporter substrate-binding protein [Deltaproteobacteria bacterium]
MKRMIMLVVFALLVASQSGAQKALPTVRIGIETPAGTNAHYHVTKQAGLFNTFPFSILSRAEIKKPEDLRGKKITLCAFGVDLRPSPDSNALRIY